MQASPAFCAQLSCRLEELLRRQLLRAKLTPERIEHEAESRVCGSCVWHLRLEPTGNTYGMTYASSPIPAAVGSRSQSGGTNHTNATMAITQMS